MTIQRTLLQYGRYLFYDTKENRRGLNADKVLYWEIVYFLQMVGNLRKRFRGYMPYVLLLIAYFFVGAIAAHPYDDAIYAQNAQFFYLFRIPPIFSLPMGIYYDFINVGGYFPTVLLSLFHVQNVVTIQIGVKIPFIIF
ncbi:MAG: hypothetical protein QXU18_11160, partial [Thermoplasmatales archaeon]